MKHPNISTDFYISGPMTGIKDHNFPKFDEGAARLRTLGYSVANPAQKGVLEGYKWEDYLRTDLTELLKCRFIVLLDGWEKSRGARLEAYIAYKLGMQFFDERYVHLAKSAYVPYFTPDIVEAAAENNTYLKFKLRVAKTLAKYLYVPVDTIQDQTSLASLGIGAENLIGLLSLLEDEFRTEFPLGVFSEGRTPTNIKSLHVLTTIYDLIVCVVQAYEKRQTIGSPVETPPIEEITAAVHATNGDSGTPASGSETICQEADHLVSIDRQNQYGHPFHDFSRTAEIWSAILGTKVTPEQVGLCMVGVKISRECNMHKRDNLVDGAGYFKCIDLIHQYRKQEEESSKKDLHAEKNV